jgi:hypothetical protein
VPAALLIVVASAFAVYAGPHGKLRFPPHAAWLFLLYPAWGLVQQFLVLAVVVGNLELVPALARRKGWVVVLGAALFAAVHGSDGWLVVATFLLELVLVPLYLRYRNLWPLGILHGWLGALFYLWVLGRDIWVENFG